MPYPRCETGISLNGKSPELILPAQLHGSGIVAPRLRWSDYGMPAVHPFVFRTDLIDQKTYALVV
jgi:hypothetical protein